MAATCRRLTLNTAERAALLAESRQDQQEVTDQLGYQVRRAVEVIVHAIDRIDKDRKRELLRGVTEPELLKIGPYQGGHGCLVIPFSRGVCGAAARTREVQLVRDVDAFPGHIACASSTRSELVIPVVGPGERLIGVLDIDSNLPDAFTPEDATCLQEILNACFQRD